MSAAQSAEAQARLQLSLRDIIEFFEKAGVEQHSVENLTEFLSIIPGSDFLSSFRNFNLLLIIFLSIL